MSQAAPRPEVGDLVVCRSDDFRATFRLPDETGLVIDLRRGEAEVFFPSIFGQTWVPDHQLARIRDPATTAGLDPWLQRVWFLAHTLGAVRLEVERFGSEGNAVRVYHGQVEVEVLDQVREGLGGELHYYALCPAGLHKMESSVGFVTDAQHPAPIPPAAPHSQDLAS